MKRFFYRVSSLQPTIFLPFLLIESIFQQKWYFEIGLEGIYKEKIKGLLELRCNFIAYQTKTLVGANGRSPLRQRFQNFINSARFSFRDASRTH